MNGGGEDTMSTPLTFMQFSDALRHVYVSEPMEHRAIFEACRSDPGARVIDTRVSLAELAAALAAVSPCLLLEDLRYRLIKGHPSIAHSWQKLCGGESTSSNITRTFQFREFVQEAVKHLSLTRNEATKAFSLIDIDSVGEITRMDFIGALCVSMPSIMFEDARHKVRQRYLSIDVAFRDACHSIEGGDEWSSELQAAKEDNGDEVQDDKAHNQEASRVEDKKTEAAVPIDDDEENHGEEETGAMGLDDSVGLNMEEFADILEKLEMGQKDTKRLFSLIDGNERGKLTLFEFFKGIRLFAPSVMLEGVRLQVLQTSWQNGCTSADTLCSAAPNQDRRAPLDRDGFKRALQRLQVQCDESQTDLIFDFLDVRDTGSISMGEMIAALQNISPGSVKQLETGVLEERAEQSIKLEMAPFHKTVTDLKRRVKQGLRDEKEDTKVHKKADDEQNGRLPRIKTAGRAIALAAKAALAEKEKERGEGPDVRLPEAGARLNSACAPPRSATAQGPQSTYYKLASRMRQVGRSEAVEDPFGATMTNLKGYFSSADSTLQDQRPVLAKSYTWIDLHREKESLVNSLNPQLVEFRKASYAARL
jgi:Ca2+-binding EF-hand superfamily protein